MTTEATAIILGVGSAHGDDRAGWETIDRLARDQANGVEYRKAGSPMDCLDALDRFRSVHIVDAACGLNRPVMRLRWSSSLDRVVLATDAMDASGHGTHGFSLTDTLRLAESMGKNLDHCVLWLIRSERFEPLTPILDDTLCAIDLCVEMIQSELRVTRGR